MRDVADVAAAKDARFFLVIFAIAIALSFAISYGFTTILERAQVRYEKSAVVEFTHDGHVYLKHRQGGVVHSESCPCRELQK